MTTLAITGGQVLRPDLTVATADVLIDQERGEILEIGPDLAGDADETLDAADSLVTPGFVNGHCHVAMTLLRGTPMINRSRRGSRRTSGPPRGADARRRPRRCRTRPARTH